MLEIAVFTILFWFLSYVVQALWSTLCWVWERWLAFRAWSLSCRLESRRRRDQKGADLREKKFAYDQYCRAQNTAALREHQQQESLIRLRRSFCELSGLPGLMSLTAEATDAGDLGIKPKRELFSEFLPTIAKETEICLRSGVATSALRTLLIQLAKACGQPDVQADLILASASTRLQQDREADERPDFASLVQQELSLHRQRLQTIELLRGDPTFQQMLEIEDQRHSEALTRLASTIHCETTVVTI